MTGDPGERDRIRAAMDRILAGTPSGPTARSYQRIRERGSANKDEVRLRATIATLRKTTANKNKELAQHRADVPALVRAVNQLTMENQRLRDMHANTVDSIIPFPQEDSRPPS